MVWIVALYLWRHQPRSEAQQRQRRTREVSWHRLTEMVWFEGSKPYLSTLRNPSGLQVRKSKGEYGPHRLRSYWHLPSPGYKLLAPCASVRCIPRLTGHLGERQVPVNPRRIKQENGSASLPPEAIRRHDKDVLGCQCGN